MKYTPCPPVEVIDEFRDTATYLLIHPDGGASRIDREYAKMLGEYDPDRLAGIGIASVNVCYHDEAAIDVDLHSGMIYIFASGNCFQKFYHLGARATSTGLIARKIEKSLCFARARIFTAGKNTGDMIETLMRSGFHYPASNQDGDVIEMMGKASANPRHEVGKFPSLQSLAPDLSNACIPESPRRVDFRDLVLP